MLVLVTVLLVLSSVLDAAVRFARSPEAVAVVHSDATVVAIVVWVFVSFTHFDAGRLLMRNALIKDAKACDRRGMGGLQCCCLCGWCVVASGVITEGGLLIEM